jgi:ABC-type multidrug transport system fused ATPase/permease subunit
MGPFDRNKNQGNEDAEDPRSSGADSAERRQSSWLEDEQAHDQQQESWVPRDREAPQASAPMTAEEMESETREQSDTRVTKEPGGPPDMTNYDPSSDSYFQNKIPGAQAREEYARSLVPPGGDPNDEYRWHTGRVRPTGVPDAVEFVEVHKSFGRNKILRGLNMGIPEGKISMILGPSGTGKSVCIKHMVGLLYPDDGDVLVHGESIPNMVDDRLFEVRKKFGVLFQDGALFGSMNLYDNVCFPLRQHTDKGEDEIEDIVMKRLREVGLE